MTRAKAIALDYGDRFYTGPPAAAITGYHVIRDVEECSDHRPVTATFDLDAAAELRMAS